MPEIAVTSPRDPRIAVYTNLPLRKRHPASDTFIAEGRLLVKRLIASRFELESVLLDPSRCEDIAAAVPDDVPVYTAPRVMLEKIAGFRFHAGVIACGRRGKRPALHELTANSAAADASATRVSAFTVCDDVFDVENLGSILRTSLALGAAGALCGPRGADPFHRRALRLSMGAAFKLPLHQPDDIPAALTQLRQAGYDIVAAVADGDAEPLSAASRSQQVAIVLGNEANGLSPATLACCNRRVTIPMHGRADSLNVAVAAGIVLHHFLPPQPPGD